MTNPKSLARPNPKTRTFRSLSQDLWPNQPFINSAWRFPAGACLQDPIWTHEVPKQAGDTAGARDFAQQAYTAAPGTTTVISLGRALDAAGEQGKSAALYSHWLREHPEDASVRMQAANDALEQPDSQAIDHYSAVLEQQPDNVVALNNLAWLLRETQPDKAMALAQRADRLAPDNPSVLDTMAMVQLAGGDTTQATRTIERALEQAPEQPSILYHSAVIANASGDKARARSTLQALLGSGQDFPESTQAEELLNTL